MEICSMKGLDEVMLNSWYWPINDVGECLLAWKTHIGIENVDNVVRVKK